MIELYSMYANCIQILNNTHIKVLKFKIPLPLNNFTYRNSLDIVFFIGCHYTMLLDWEEGREEAKVW